MILVDKDKNVVATKYDHIVDNPSTNLQVSLIAEYDGVVDIQDWYKNQTQFFVLSMKDETMVIFSGRILDYKLTDGDYPIEVFVELNKRLTQVDLTS